MYTSHLLLLLLLFFFFGGGTKEKKKKTPHFGTNKPGRTNPDKQKIQLGRTSTGEQAQGRKSPLPIRCLIKQTVCCRVIRFRVQRGKDV